MSRPLCRSSSQPTLHHPTARYHYIPLLCGMVNLLGQIVDEPAIVQALAPANTSPPNSQVSSWWYIKGREGPMKKKEGGQEAVYRCVRIGLRPWRWMFVPPSCKESISLFAYFSPVIRRWSADIIFCLMRIRFVTINNASMWATESRYRYRFLWNAGSR
jgi:hypothetical protein